MNPQTTSETSLPFFDASARRVRLPQPTSNHFQPQSDTAFLSQKSFKTRVSRRTASHTRTPSWGSTSSSSSENHSPRPSTSSLGRYHQCFTPESSRSPSPMTHMSLQPMNVRTPARRPRSPPLTPPPAIQTSPASTPGNYCLRLEPVSANETAQAAVVFPDATNPQRALLLVGPAIARYVRERGKSARMHPYRVVFRPSP
ncbi:hypothetical protein ACGC1H_001498 [Rhizoctonia solani]|uniref:Uncharacterized protein n=1 Tax=Rhizoctonia solani TaxID=456999 RepID=A0A8H2XU09_9AGAM|nr:unnamed protein product [Rhizoctonia solani]